MRLNLYIQTYDVFSDGVLCRARSQTWWTCVSLPAQDTLWFYSIPFWLSRDLFPVWWCRSQSSFPHRLSGTVKPARMSRMQRTKLCLCSGQHSHLPVLDSPSSPHHLKTIFWPFPSALTTAMPPRVQLGAEQSLHTEILLRWFLAQHRTPYNVSHAAESHLSLYQLFPPLRAWNRS